MKVPHPDHMRLLLEMAGIDCTFNTQPPKFWTIVRDNWSEWAEIGLIIPVLIRYDEIYFYWSILPEQGFFSMSIMISPVDVTLTSAAIQRVPEQFRSIQSYRCVDTFHSITQHVHQAINQGVPRVPSVRDLRDLQVRTQHLEAVLGLYGITDAPPYLSKRNFGTVMQNWCQWIEQGIIVPYCHSLKIMRFFFTVGPHRFRWYDLYTSHFDRQALEFTIQRCRLVSSTFAARLEQPDPVSAMQELAELIHTGNTAFES